jgi:hypothetical protein
MGEAWIMAQHGARGTGHGTRDSGLGTRDSGLGTRDSGLGTRERLRVSCSDGSGLVWTLSAKYQRSSNAQNAEKKLI